jgi:ABC-type oligopeptide transport system ATPase subunit
VFVTNSQPETRFANPREEYTRNLLEAIPGANIRLGV